ncbi:hypothetical protein [Pendulispora albinea]|uniref:Uncharacterized protein n=1 Tax=Pendulispora albinea TaxID=2741071 RepID=A0ABZ2LPB5_9BACT
MSGYPSHEFVIDREDAATLFRSVREPTIAERALEDLLRDVARKPFDELPKPVILYLDREVGSDDQREEIAERSSRSVDAASGSSASA